MEITYSPLTGFLRDASYSANLHDIGKEFENKFGELEALHIELKEVHPESVENQREEPFKFSADKKKCTIKLLFIQYRDTKGKITGKPLPYEVFQQLRFVLNRAVKEY